MSRWWPSRKLLARVVALLAATLVLLSGGATVVPDWNGVVTGGVFPCAGIVGPEELHFAGGTVTVLRGEINWQNPAEPAFPTGVVAQERVPAGGTFQFVLEPGQYVLTTEFPPPSNYIPYSTLTLQPGDNLRVDIPNQCM
jgi:hypothetical protein